MSDDFVASLPSEYWPWAQRRTFRLIETQGRREERRI
jgi:hypothetical protein